MLTYKYFKLIFNIFNKNLNFLSFSKAYTFHIIKSTYFRSVLSSQKISLQNEIANTERTSREAEFNGWFESWIGNLRSDKNSRTDWKDQNIFNEMRDQRLNYHNLLLSKLSQHTEYTPGLYENASALCDHIELQQTSVNHKNSFLKAAKIFINIFQKREEEKCIKMYRDLCKESDYLFDPTTCSMLISAMCQTKIWKESLKLLEVHVLMQKPSPAVISNVMLAAWKYKDLKTFDYLVKELEGKLPAVSFVEGMVEIGQVEEMLKLTNTYSWVLNEAMADVVFKHFNNQNTPGLKAAKVKINKRKCSNCGFQLSPHTGLSEVEMEELRVKFMKNVFVRKDDVFLSSSPKEVATFKTFINDCRNYDVVIDSLNVAYLLHYSQKVDAVMRRLIESFVGEGKNVLVLSRQHLRKSLKTSIDFSKNNVRWFFVENRSHDDLFALYACFHGNKGCILVTNDQLRNYSFQLGGKFSKLFTRWQERHQIVFNGVDHKTKKLLFRKGIDYDTIVEWSDSGRRIHVPCKRTSSSVATYERANFWLCIQKDSDRKLK